MKKTQQTLNQLPPTVSAISTIGQALNVKQSGRQIFLYLPYREGNLGSQKSRDLPHSTISDGTAGEEKP